MEIWIIKVLLYIKNSTHISLWPQSLTSQYLAKCSTLHCLFYSYFNILHDYKCDLLNENWHSLHF